jgi:type IV pilus assembly protein PilQ
MITPPNPSNELRLHMAHTTRARIFKATTVVGLLLSAFSAWANSLEAVSVNQGTDNSQVIKITLSDALAAMPMYFTTTNPHRIILDFPNIDDAMGRRSETIDTGVVHGYNVVHSADRTRVVVDLNGPATYDLRKDKNVLLIALKGAQVAPGTVEPAHFASTGNSTFDIRDVSFHRGNNGEGRIEVNLSDPGVGIDIKQKGPSIQVDFLNTTLPQALQRKLDVSEFATPAQSIETFAQGKSTRMIVTPRGKWDYVAYQTGKNFILEVTSLDNTSGQGEQKRKYDGEKLSLDFQNVDVRSVLKVIADFTGVNIVAADSVTGNVTIRLKDVPWDQALDIILRAKGLGKRVNGNVIWVEQSDLLTKKEEEEKRARQSSEQLEPLVTRNYKLNYVRADDAMAMIAGLSRTNNTSMTAPTCSPSSEGLVNLNQQANTSTPGSSTSVPSQFQGQNTGSPAASNRVLSTRGSATYDLTTNTLIVTDIADRQTKVEEVLKGIDIPSKQVMIEARIVIADDSFGRELGAKLGIQRYSGGTGTGIAATGSGSYSAATASSTVSPTYNVNLPATNTLSTASVASLGYTLIDAANNRLLSLELSALETDQRGKVISNPKVITTNLKPAVILQGTQIPYQTSSANTGTNTQFKDALLCLLVAPQVLNNDDIILDVEVQKDQPDTSYTPPAINVKRVETQVRVKNGETAVLGGIFEQTQRNDTNKVPLLGDIPVLGALFRNNAKSDEKTEMLIFLTPRVLQ